MLAIQLPPSPPPPPSQWLAADSKRLSWRPREENRCNEYKARSTTLVASRRAGHAALQGATGCEGSPTVVGSSIVGPHAFPRERWAVRWNIWLHRRGGISHEWVEFTVSTTLCGRYGDGQSTCPGGTPQLTKRVSLRRLHTTEHSLYNPHNQTRKSQRAREKESTGGIHTIGRPPQFEPNRWPDPQERP